MRSLPLKAAGIFILVAAWACGGDDGGVGPNNPVANFNQTCTGLTCTFTDASTPAGQVTWSWNFNDPNSPTNTSTDQNPSHTFSAAGTYQVQLTVTSTTSGATNSKTNPVTVTAGTGNQNPVASFTPPTGCNAGTPCGFSSTSTDPDGNETITTFAWGFGDPTSSSNTAETADATHTFATAGTYSVTLTVTDNQGGTGTTTQSVVVAGATSQTCTTTGTTVDCTLSITDRSTVTFTMGPEACDFSGNKLTIVAPVVQTVFFNLCNRTQGETKTITDQSGQPLAIPAGTQMVVRFHQGAGDPGDPPTTDPGVRIEGTYPSWTLDIDDGGNAGAPGEPDFDDAVVDVDATRVPATP